MANITLHKNSSTSGSGSNTIKFDWGKNQTRSDISRTYRSTDGVNKLVVRQTYSALAHNAIGQTEIQTASSDSPQTFTFRGEANGKYLMISSGTFHEDTVQCTVGNQAITSTATLVSAFEGGTSKYTYTISWTVPANAAEAVRIIDIKTMDSAQGQGISVRYQLSVTSETVALESVTVTPSTLDIGIGNSYRYNNSTVYVNSSSRNQLTYALSPSNATIKSVVWESSNTNVATVSSSGLVTGVSEGTATITCRVTDNSDPANIESDSCSIRVYAEGTITGDSIKDITSITTSSSHNITLRNIDRSTIAASPRSSVAWLTGVSVNTSTTPPTVDMITSTNTGADRDVEIDVTATDYLLNTVSHSFSLVQRTPSVDDVPCENIYFSASSTVINNSENKGDYTISYTPTETTQRALSWVLTGGGEGIATLEVDSEFSNRAYIHVFSGANNTPLTLTVTNTDTKTTPQKSASVSITATYVNNDGYLTANPSVVQLAYNDTVNDTTNGAPVITGTNMYSIDNEPVLISGTIPKTMRLQGGVLYSTFDPNDDPAGTSPRVGTVRVSGTDNGGTRRYCDINYSQSPIGQDVNADMQISAVQAVYTGNAVTALKIAVSYDNPFARNVVFSNQSVTIKGTTDTGTVTLDEITRQLSDKSVPMLSNDSVEVYTISVEPRSAVTRFYIRMLATVNNSTITRPVQETWWDGTDIIDEQ